MNFTAAYEQIGINIFSFSNHNSIHIRDSQLHDTSMIKINDATRRRLRQVIEETGLNYREFACSLGVNPSVITEIMSGRTAHISRAMRTVIQLKYGINTRWLISGEDPQYIRPTVVACPKEYELICNYRKLSPELKNSLIVFAGAMYLQQQELETS